MKLNTIRITEPVKVDSRLAALGLSRDELVAALREGALAGRDVTAHNPVTSAGYYRWSEGTRALRDLLVPKGWAALDVDGLPVVLNKDLGIAISLSSGDEATGDPSSAETPSTKNPKGIATRRAVYEDQGVLEAVEAAEPQTIDRRRVPGYVQWILLHTEDSDGNIHAELSRPGSLDGAGRVDGWSERLVLGEIDGGSDITLGAEPEAPEPPIVEVSRKGN